MEESKLFNLDSNLTHVTEDKSQETEENRMLFEAVPETGGLIYHPGDIIEQVDDPLAAETTIEFVSPDDLSSGHTPEAQEQQLSKRQEWVKQDSDSDLSSDVSNLTDDDQLDTQATADKNMQVKLQLIKDKISIKASNFVQTCMIESWDLEKVNDKYKALLLEVNEEITNKKVVKTSHGKRKRESYVKFSRNDTMTWSKIVSLTSLDVELKDKSHWREICTTIEKLNDTLSLTKRFDIRIILIAFGTTLAASGISANTLQEVLLKVTENMGEKNKSLIMQGATNKYASKGQNISVKSSNVDYEGIVTIKEAMFPTIKIDNDDHSSSVVIQHTIGNKLLSVDNVSDVFQKIVKETKIVIFDTPNMNRHMRLSIEQIELLAQIFNTLGVTTLNLVEDKATALENIDINVVVEDDEHDDIVALLYSYAYNAVIITNDHHKEFGMSVKCCEKHRQIMLRTNDMCRYAGNDCVIRSIRLSDSRYMSIKAMSSLESKYKIVFNAPIIRYRSSKVKGTAVGYITKESVSHREHIFAKKKIMTGGPNRWITLLKPGNANLNFSITSLTIDSLSTTVTDYGKYTTISHVLSHLSQEALESLTKKKLPVIKVDPNNEIKIVNSGGEQLFEVEDIDIVTKLRHKTMVRIISKVYDVEQADYCAPYTRSIMDDVYKFKNKTHYVHQIMMSKFMLQHKLALLRSSNNIIIAKADDTFIRMMVDDTLQIASTKNTNLMDLMKSTIADHEMVFKYLSKSIVVHSDQKEADNDLKNNFNNMILGPPLARQVTNIDKETSDFIISQHDDFIEMVNPSDNILESTGKKQFTDCDAATSKMWYDISVQGYNDFMKVKPINMENINNMLKTLPKSEMLQHAEVTGIKEFEGDNKLDEDIIAENKKIVDRKSRMRIGLRSTQKHFDHKPLSSSFYENYIPRQTTYNESELYDQIPTIKYVQTTDEISTTFTNISKHDAQILINSFETHGTKIVKNIMRDIVSSLNNIMYKSVPLALPPFIWSYIDYSHKMMYNTARMLAMMKVMTNDYIVDVYYWITDKMVVTIRFKPGYWTLFPAVAMMYGNSFTNLPNSIPEMRMEVDVQFSMFKNVKLVMAHSEMYFDYWKVFAMPLILVGVDPIIKLLEYRPVVVSNVIQRFEPWTEPYDKWDDYEITVEYMIINDDSFTRHYVKPLKRKMENGKIKIWEEIHNIIDTTLLYKHFQGYDNIVEKYMSILRPLYKWEDILMHLNVCYDAQLPTSSKWYDVIDRMNSKPILHAEKCLCKHYEQDIMISDVSAGARIFDKATITTSKSIMHVASDYYTQINTVRSINIDWITADMPIRGKYTLIKLKLKKGGQQRRAGVVMSLIKNRRDMMVTIVEPKIGYNTNICNLISDTMHDSFKKKRDVIIVGSDTLGPVIKKYDDTIRVDQRYKQHLYIPDILLYNSIKAKIELINIEKVAGQRSPKRTTNKIEKQMRSNKNKDIMNVYIARAKTNASTIYKSIKDKKYDIKVVLYVTLVVLLMALLPYYVNPFNYLVKLLFRITIQNMFKSQTGIKFLIYIIEYITRVCINASVCFSTYIILKR